MLRKREFRSARSASSEGAIETAFVVAVFDGGAFVELFFAFGEAEKDFGEAALEIDFEWDERGTVFFLDAQGEFADFTAMEEQTAIAGGIVVHLVGFDIFLDVAAHEGDLAFADAGEALAKLDVPFADGFHFAADEFDAAFDFVEDFVVEVGAAVLDARRHAALFFGFGRVLTLFGFGLRGGGRSWGAFAHGQ